MNAQYFRQVGRFLGEGAYGSVYEAENEDGKKVAVKKLTYTSHYDYCQNPFCDDDFCECNDGHSKYKNILNEKFILKETTHHPNIVEFLDFHEDRGIVFLIFDIYPYDLSQFLELRGKMEIELIKKFSRQLLNGVAFLQSKGVMHRDLKPQNIMVDHQQNLKICDFGLSVSDQNRYYNIFDLEEGDTHQIQTLWYRAPEILLGISKYSNSIDTWSIGCIIAEMIDGNILFQGDSEIGQLFEIFKIKGTPHNEEWKDVEELPCYSKNFPQLPAQKTIKTDIDPGLEDLLQRLLEYHPMRRIRPYQAIDHYFFNKK